MNTAAIRAVLAGHQPHGVRRAVELLLAEMDKQQEQIDGLREALSNQYERHSNQIMDLRKQIERLKGVHGA